MRELACAVASSRRGEPIFATASQVRRWLLVEVRGSWGRDSIANTDLGRHVDDGWRARMRAEGVRVVAIRRDLDRIARDSLHMFYVESTGGGTVWRREIAGLHGVMHATMNRPGLDDPTPGWTRHDDGVVLVCTNGKHDACCATFGRPVVRALRTSQYADAVWECSHIGGDRFAGNVVILPDGLYFGRCTPESALTVLDRYQDGQLDLDHYRGRSTLGFTHQAAEYFARRKLGLTRREAIASVRRVGDPAEGRFVVVLADSALVTVTVHRTTEPAPSPLTCTGAGGVSLPRYELVEFDSDSAGTSR